MANFDGTLPDLIRTHYDGVEVDAQPYWAGQDITYWGRGTQEFCAKRMGLPYRLDLFNLLTPSGFFPHYKV
jgi:hypothetical protein